MQQPATRGRRCRRKHAYGSVVDGNGLARLIFRQVHRGISSGVDEPLRSGFRHCTRDGLLIADVEFSASPYDNVVMRGGRRDDRTRDLAAAAEHQHSHANFSISA
jgi:hypothetical protein